MAKEWTASEMARKAGRLRAEHFSKRQIRAWGKLGGRPSVLTGKARERLERMLEEGRPHAEIVKAFGISLRSVGRYKQRLRKAAKKGVT
jgi:DNA invertase Pin-like site-specific DNA recombinase